MSIVNLSYSGNSISSPIIGKQFNFLNVNLDNLGAFSTYHTTEGSVMENVYNKKKLEFPTNSALRTT